MADSKSSNAPPGASFPPDDQGAGPLSKVLELVLTDALARGLCFPVVASIVAANRSCVTVAYEGIERIAVTMLCGHVARDGYRLPAFALLVDPMHQALLALVDSSGAHRVLYGPELRPSAGG